MAVLMVITAVPLQVAYEPTTVYVVLTVGETLILGLLELLSQV